MAAWMAAMPAMAISDEGGPGEAWVQLRAELERTGDPNRLVTAVRTAGEAGCRALMYGIGQQDLSESQRVEIIDFLPRLAGCVPLNSALQALDQLDSSYLRARLARQIGALVGTASDQDLLSETLARLEGELREVLGSARGYPKLGVWWQEMERLGWWTYAQRRAMSALRAFDAREGALASDISDRYWIIYGLRDSWERKQASDAAERVQDLAGEERSQYLAGLASSSSTYSRRVALDLYIGEEPPNLLGAKALWSDVDIELDRRFLELMGRYHRKELLGFVLDRLALMCRDLKIRGDISKGLLNPGEIGHGAGVELSELALALEQAMSAIGDVRGILAAYGKGHFDYPCPGLLVDLLTTQLWNHRGQGGGVDADEDAAMGFLGGLSARAPVEVANRIQSVMKDLTRVRKLEE